MELTVQSRTILGKKIKTLRQQGLIPAELYGHNFENLHLSVPAKEFSRLFKEAGESTIIKLKIKNQKSKIEDKENDKLNVLVHDIQKNSLTDEITHIDFYRVRMDEKITAMIPLKFIGEAPAVKEKGGLLVKIAEEIKVESLPADLPHKIEIDLKPLADIGVSIHIKDIKLPKGVKILIDQETVIVTVIEPVVEEVKEAPVIEVEATAVAQSTEAEVEIKAKTENKRGDKKEGKK